MTDEPTDIGKLGKHAVVAHARHRETRVERKTDNRSQHVLAKRVRLRRNHRMKKDAQLHSIRFGKERAILRRGQRLTADVAEQNHAVKLQLAECALKFV